MSKYKVGDTVQIVGTIEQVTSEDYLVDCGACLSGYVSEKRVVKTYEDGLADAWDAARKIHSPTAGGGIPANVVQELFGNGNPHVNYTAQEAIAKIKAYEDSKEIRRGDEVKYISSASIGVVLWKNNDRAIVLYPDDCVDHVSCKNITKTGRNLADKLDALLAEIGG